MNENAIKFMFINNPQVANNVGCIRVVFKIVDSKDAVINATQMYLRRILKAKLETTCNKFIVIKTNSFKHVSQMILRTKFMNRINHCFHMFRVNIRQNAMSQIKHMS